MSGEPEYYIEFRCDSCSKRLKAKPKHAGRRLRCPNCHTELRIPGTKLASGSSSNLGSSPSNVVTEDEPQSLNSKLDVTTNTIPQTAPNTESKEPTEKPLNRPRKNSFDVDDLQLESVAISDLEDRKRTSDEIRQEKETKRRLQLAAEERRRQERESQDQVEPLSRQKMDFVSEEDDYNLLPDLSPANSQSRANIESLLDSELPKLAPEANSTESKKATTEAAEVWDESPTPSFYDDTIEDRYRIACPICGTVQYVTVDAQGTQAKCPDCFSKFLVPRPPANWTPSKISKRHNHFNTSSPLQGDDDVRQVDMHRQQMTSEMLEKAEMDLANEKTDEDRYGVGDFDTNSFFQRTFGFAKDPVAMGFVFGYGLVFALVFFLIQFGILNQQNGFFGKGSTLFCIITGPLMALLFILTGVAFSILLLFPVFLLSILDSGHLLGLVSVDVLRSMREVAEGWAGYYFKSLIFTALTMLLWFLLLGKSAVLAAFAGATFPFLVFFLFQQVGGLADLIGEHLSFSFDKSTDESDTEKVQDLEDAV